MANDNEAEVPSGLDERPARVVVRVLSVLPDPLRIRLLRHRELLKFLIVGGTCFVITIVINYILKFTILSNKPVTALTVATIIATVVSYVLNREWSFRTRGGRERHHEAALFFAISGLGVVINSGPMWIARYLFNLREPYVSVLVQEVSDFVFGILLGALVAMVFRLWAFKKWVFPEQNARPGRSSIPPHLDLVTAPPAVSPATPPVVSPASPPAVSPAAAPATPPVQPLNGDHRRVPDYRS